MLDSYYDARAIQDESGLVAEEKFGDKVQFWGGPGDAFQHCLGSCSVAEEEGVCSSKIAGELNEVFGSDNRQPWDAPMDRYNNAAGMACAGADDCERCCTETMLGGELTWNHEKYKP